MTQLLKKMAEGEGFEPPERFRSPVFKTGAISQTLPTLELYIAPVDGIEPRLRVLETPVLPLHHTGF